MTPLIGHDEAVAAFRAALGRGQTHHAWLLGGAKGIGKRRFADAAAARFLAEGAGAIDADRLDLPDDHPTAKLIAAGSHPDFMKLERLYREKTADHARSITVDQVRGLQRLFATTTTFSSRRAVVIDAVDDLERGAANALLKSLEEPPAGTIFLLVAHAPGRLLPTIRSRCRLLRFQPLDARAMRAVLSARMPEAEPSEIDALARTGGGAPGDALRFAGLDIMALDDAIDTLVRHGDPQNIVRSGLARALALKAAQPRYEAFVRRVPSRIAAEARTRTGAALAQAVASWEQARAIAATALAQSDDPQATVFAMAGLLAALAPQPGRAKA